MDKELDQLLQDYESKRQAEAADKARLVSEEQRRRAVAIHAVVAIVTPVLEDLSEDLRGRGHDSEVSVDAVSYFPPSAQISFRLRDRQGQICTGYSRLSFSTINAEDQFVEVRREIWTTHGQRDDPDLKGTDTVRKMSLVSTKWVRAQVIGFVGAAIKQA